MIKVIAIAKISWNFDDVDLPDNMPMDEIKAKFAEEFDQEMKDYLQAAEKISIETLEIQQETN